MNSISGGNCPVSEELRIDEGLALCPGTPIVAVERLCRLRDTGLPCGMQFGIISTNGEVIMQECCSGDINHPEFTVVKKGMADFCPKGWSLLQLPLPESSPNLAAIHKRALRELNTTYGVLRSFPGDDFVAYCLTGDTSTVRSRANAAIGQHWWTPLYYNVQELQAELTKAVQGALGINVSLPPPSDKFNVECLHFKHHGILIEDNWVVHFARCRVPDGSNQIKLDPLDVFCDITPYAEPGGPCDYENDTEYKRILHRNRAVWIFFHSEEWGAYNLFTNNCEHMSRVCKVGRKQSAQVKNGVAQAALTALGLLIPGGFAARLAAMLGITVAHKKLLPRIMKHLPAVLSASND